MNDVSLLDAAARRRHLEMLLMSCAVVALAVVLDVRPDHQVSFRFLPNWPLPPSCASRAIFGVPCPGCGLTRSFVYLAHGEWQASLEMHRLGWLLALAVVFQFPYRLAALLGRKDRPLGSLAPAVFCWTLIFLLLANWVLQIVEQIGAGRGCAG